MYGSSLRLVTRTPRDARIAASDAAAMPFPSEETTPPVTKTNLVMASQVPEIRILPEPSAPPRESRRASTRPRAIRSESRAVIRASVVVAAQQRQHASIAGVCACPATSARSAIITCGGFTPCCRRGGLDRGAERLARPLERRELAVRARSSAARSAGVDLLGEQRGDRRAAWRRNSAPHPPSRRAWPRGRAAARATRADGGSRRQVEPRARRETASSRRAELVGVEHASCARGSATAACSGSKRPGDGVSPRRSNQSTNSSTREHFGVAVRPAEAREVVDDRLGQVAVVAVLQDAARAVALRQLVAVGRRAPSAGARRPAASRRARAGC